MTRTPPAVKSDKRHTETSPFPIHNHGKWYIVDEMCKCGQLRSDHEDTHVYGYGASFDGRCKRFTWNGFVENPPWVSCTAKEPKSKFLKTLLGEPHGKDSRNR